MARPGILAVLSSAPQGWYLPEFAHPYEVLSPHCDITVVSPKGGATVVDPTSIELFKDDAYCMDFLKTKQKIWTETQKLEDYIGKAKDFASIFIVGGFGPMFDLATDAASIKLIREFYDSDRIVTAVCHGSAALLNVKLADGSSLIEGERVTGFSNAEEVAFATRFDPDMKMPFHLETQLGKVSGGHYEKSAEAWSPKVIVSTTKKLLMGQNPASAKPLAEELLKKLPEWA